jgi:hypothetical protein
MRQKREIVKSWRGETSIYLVPSPSLSRPILVCPENGDGPYSVYPADLFQKVSAIHLDERGRTAPVLHLPPRFGGKIPPDLWEKVTEAFSNSFPGDKAWAEPVVDREDIEMSPLDDVTDDFLKMVREGPEADFCFPSKEHLAAEIRRAHQVSQSPNPWKNFHVQGSVFSQLEIDEDYRQLLYAFEQTGGGIVFVNEMKDLCHCIRLYLAGAVHAALGILSAKLEYFTSPGMSINAFTTQLPSATAKLCDFGMRKDLTLNQVLSSEEFYLKAYEPELVKYIFSLYGLLWDQLRCAVEDFAVKKFHYCKYGDHWVFAACGNNECKKKRNAIEKRKGYWRKKAAERALKTILKESDAV